MADLILGVLFILLLLLMVSFPSGFKRVLARISFQDESAMPEYPVGAAGPLILLFAWVLVVPGIQSLGGVTRVEMGTSRLFLLAMGIALVLAGLGLAMWPQQFSRALRWPQVTSTLQVFVSQLVGTALMIGGTWLLRFGIA